jgi:hypothetical protein
LKREAMEGRKEGMNRETKAPEKKKPRKQFSFFSGL